MKLSTFVSELCRRRVFRVAAAYARVELRIGDRARAEQFLRRREEVARREWQECGGTCENEPLAAMLAMQGRTEEALHFMQRTVDNGWRGVSHLNFHLGLNEDLAGEPGYQRLIAEVRRQRANLAREGL